jgi:hypothetical protein
MRSARPLQQFTPSAVAISSAKAKMLASRSFQKSSLCSSKKSSSPCIVDTREVYPEVYEDRSEIGGLDYEFDSGSDMSMSDYTWELCFDNKNQWEHDVRTHMEDGGNNDVCTTHRGETRANQGSRSYASTSAWKPSSCTRFLTLQPLVT